jgi:hypothetical protein
MHHSRKLLCTLPQMQVTPATGLPPVSNRRQSSLGAGPPRSPSPTCGSLPPTDLPRVDHRRCPRGTAHQTSAATSARRGLPGPSRHATSTLGAVPPPPPPRAAFLCCRHLAHALVLDLHCPRYSSSASFSLFLTPLRLLCTRSAFRGAHLPVSRALRRVFSSTFIWTPPLFSPSSQVMDPLRSLPTR